MTFADVVNFLPIELLIQSAVTLAALLDFIEGHWLPLGAIIARIPSLGVLTALHCLYNCRFVMFCYAVFFTRLCLSRGLEAFGKGAARPS